MRIARLSTWIPGSPGSGLLDAVDRAVDPAFRHGLTGEMEECHGISWEYHLNIMNIMGI